MGHFPFQILFVIYILIAAFIFAVVAFRGPYIAKRARAKVLSEPWIDARDLVRDWAGEGKYKAADGLGCYMLLVFDHEVTDGNYEGYQEVYVGKANKAYKGAYAQLTGHGKCKEIAKDYKNKNRYVYVQARFYDKEDVNKMERTLVGSMKAQESYNKGFKQEED